MKIKSIKLFNIGPYVGDNRLEFTIENKSKNIVLIGGKNGAGKTSLFNAVKVCMYGCRAFGYESINQFYFDGITKIINAQAMLSKNAVAEIMTELLLDDGKKDYTYRLTRQWFIDGKKTREVFSVIKNQTVLNEKEKADFEKYIFQLIPPDLFKFYFFDGEKLADFAFDDTKNNDFKRAFLKLCGLDTLELILTNFRRTYRGSANKSSLANEYDRLQAEQLAVNEQIDKKGLQKAEVIREKVSNDEELAMLENSYSNAGGVDVKAWKGMHDEIKRQEAMRAEKRKWLKEIANNVIPFVILAGQLKDLKVQIELESKIHSERIVKQEISNPKLSKKLDEIFKRVHFEHPPDLTQLVIGEILSAISNGNTAESEEYLSLSPREQLELISKINTLLAFEVKRIEDATKDIEKSLQVTEKIREKIKKSTIMDFETFLSSKDVLIEKKAVLINQSMEVEKELLELIVKDMQIATEFKRVKAKYEEELRDKSIKDISARAILAFEQLQSSLHDKFIMKVESDFRQTFNALINKSDLLDGIFIDEFLRVIPYKNTEFRRNELVSLKQKFGEEHLINMLGKKAYEMFSTVSKGSDEKIELPAEVKKQLSAGEKQIFIMALYKALVGLNKVNVPYIIDTPFARIDGEHRKKILKEFFVKLTGQVIILSTDEEIVNEYKEIIKNKIANTFVLQHENGGSSRIIGNSYFGD